MTKTVAVDDRQFHVRVSTSEGRVTFYDTDSMSGGYPSFTTYGAGKRLTLDEAKDVVKELLRPNNEEGFPNPMIHNATGLNNRLTKTNATIEIVEAVYQVIDTIEVEARLTVEDVEAERARRRNEVLSRLSPEDIKALGL